MIGTNGGISQELLTTTKENFKRLKVESALTSFMTGKQFRTFKEFNLANGATRIIRITAPCDFILWELSAAIDAGSVRITTLAGGTPTGTFSETLPIIPKNTMSSRPTPTYTNQLTVDSIPSGGSLSGGTMLDIIRVIAANSTAQQTTVESGTFSERGIAAGTYYIKIENIGIFSVTGVIRAFWSEEE